jgi:quercetin dioxygenase-like cupin family protein
MCIDRPDTTHRAVAFPNAAAADLDTDKGRTKEKTMTPDIPRFLTTHDETGLARFAPDRQLGFRVVDGGDARFALIWTTDRSPADNADETDGADRQVSLALKGGSVLRVVDIRPGARSPMHRTVSIDYGIVLEGEIVLELDSGEERTVPQGGIVIQRGTNHAWVNRTEDWVRIAFVLLDAEPLVIGGHVLGDIDVDH